MDVDVRDGLARRDAVVDPDIEAVGTVLLRQVRSHPVGQLPQSETLQSGQIGKCRYVHTWDYQSVTGRNREFIENCRCRWRLVQHLSISDGA